MYLKLYFNFLPTEYPTHFSQNTSNLDKTKKEQKYWVCMPTLFLKGQGHIF